ncbi:hypothetical protein EAS68_10350 [Legionella jordanis]|nr:hypothetical protein EAS68_10350 [Legionella jordanis]
MKISLDQKLDYILLLRSKKIVCKNIHIPVSRQAWLSLRYFIWLNRTVIGNGTANKARFHPLLVYLQL